MNLNCWSFLFMLYTRLEGIAHQHNSQALTALALLIAESKPANKNLMVRLVTDSLVERGA